MKLFRYFLISIALSFVLFSCGKKATKEQAVEFYSKMNEYAMSSEFGKDFAKSLSSKDTVVNWEKIEKSINEIILERENKLAKEIGLNSFETIAKDSSLASLPEVKMAIDKFKKNIMMHSHLIMTGHNPGSGMQGIDAMHGTSEMPPKSPSANNNGEKR